MAVTENSDYAAIENQNRRKCSACSFIPKWRTRRTGREIIANFVHNICGCGKNWTMHSYIDQAVEAIRAQVGNEKVILGLSGGVDSSVAAALLHKAIGESTHVHFRQQRPVARTRSDGGAGGFRPPFQDQAAIRGRLASVPSAVSKA